MNTLWRIGGFLTNSHSPKKFRSHRKKIVFGPTQPPDCLMVFDSERKSSVILEAHRLQVPIVSLVDSDMPIVYLFCNLITKTFILQQKKSGVDSAEIETRCVGVFGAHQ
ncbi:putative ribosomal protein S2, flavodoxin [Rosa chinensis]|uniref:Putative ribosomal protein S2, flavodoxin n=1 Tax=Rosa chinensis TaxID=74649 RepID=A0A2P6QG49_ROSCH|nr:putative ribosomal protein S2, flavodoxin [Rosa chinensis]